jgi:hypothetical protein
MRLMIARVSRQSEGGAKAGGGDATAEVETRRPFFVGLLGGVDATSDACSTFNSTCSRFALLRRAGDGSPAPATARGDIRAAVGLVDREARATVWESRRHAAAIIRDSARAEGN